MAGVSTGHEQQPFNANGEQLRCRVVNFYSKDKTTFTLSHERWSADKDAQRTGGGVGGARRSTRSSIPALIF